MNTLIAINFVDFDVKTSTLKYDIKSNIINGELTCDGAGQVAVNLALNADIIESVAIQIKEQFFSFCDKGWHSDKKSFDFYLEEM